MTDMMKKRELGEKDKIIGDLQRLCERAYIEIDENYEKLSTKVNMQRDNETTGDKTQ